MENLSKIIVIRLKEQRYGVDIRHVRSIERLEHITPIPRTSSFIKGMIKLQEQIIPIIDLKERLHLDEIGPTDDTRILIVSMNDMPVGLIVDAATDVLDIDPSIIDNAPAIVGEISSTYTFGVAKLPEELLVLLNVGEILSLEELTEVKEVIEQA